jgi:hypothetical protein
MAACLLLGWTLFPALHCSLSYTTTYDGVPIPGKAMYGKGTLHKIFPREAHVESELSLQTRREFLQQMIPQYRKATTVKKKSKLLDAFTTTTGYNRKYTMWLLNHAQVGQPAPQHSRPRRDAAGGPTRAVPGLACHQPHLLQTPHALSPHVCRSGLQGMGTSTSTSSAAGNCFP